MVDKCLVTLGEINEETFNKVYNNMLKDGLNYVHFYYTQNTYGIFYQGVPVGLFRLDRWIERNISISIAILNEYRGNGIAPIATDLIVDVFGEYYPDAKEFLANINPNNESSARAINKAGWKVTYEYNELMMEEGAEWFNVYYRNNPYYEKEGGLKP